MMARAARSHGAKLHDARRGAVHRKAAVRPERALRGADATSAASLFLRGRGRRARTGFRHVVSSNTVVACGALRSASTSACGSGYSHSAWSHSQCTGACGSGSGARWLCCSSVVHRWLNSRSPGDCSSAPKPSSTGGRTHAPRILPATSSRTNTSSCACHRMRNGLLARTRFGTTASSGRTRLRINGGRGSAAAGPGSPGPGTRTKRLDCKSAGKPCRRSASRSNESADEGSISRTPPRKPWHASCAPRVSVRFGEAGPNGVEQNSPTSTNSAGGTSAPSNALNTLRSLSSTSG